MGARHSSFQRPAFSTVNAAELAPENLRPVSRRRGRRQIRSIGPVHVQINVGAPNHPVVKWIRWTYLALIPLTLGFMIVHNLLDFLAKLIRRHPRHETGAQFRA